MRERRGPFTYLLIQEKAACNPWNFTVTVHFRFDTYVHVMCDMWCVLSVL